MVVRLAGGQRLNHAVLLHLGISFGKEGLFCLLVVIVDFLIYTFQVLQDLVQLGLRANLDDELRLISTLHLMLVFELDEVFELQLRQIYALSHCRSGRLGNLASLPVQSFKRLLG